VTVMTAARSASERRPTPPAAPFPTTSWRLQLVTFLVAALIGWLVVGDCEKTLKGWHGQSAVRLARVPKVAFGVATVLVLVVMTTVACAGGGGTTGAVSGPSGTPAGTYTLTLSGTYTGTGGNLLTLTRSTSLTLTVN
jgi:hypothetical protein